MTNEAVQPDANVKSARDGAHMESIHQSLGQPMLAYAQSFVQDWLQADVITKSAFAELSDALTSGEAVVDADAWLRKRIQEVARGCSPAGTVEPHQQTVMVAPHVALYVSREERIRRLEEELPRTARRCRGTELNRLFSEYASLKQRMLVAIAVRITQSVHTAEDVAQEALMALHRRLLDERVVSGLGPWLTRTVVNLAINHARRQLTRRTLPLELQHVAGDISSPDDVRVLTEATVQAWKHFASLPENQRRIVELRTFEGMDYDKIGSTLGISAAAARQQHYRTLLRLKWALSEWWDA